MDSWARVHAALRREAVDRVPVFMWFHPETALRLAAFLGCEQQDEPFAFGNDVIQTWIGNNYAMEGIVHERDGEEHVDDFGIRWRKEGAFNQIVTSPLQGWEPEDVRAYRFPEIRMDEVLAPLATVSLRRGNRFLGCDVSPCVFELYNRLRGMEDALFDMAAEPETADALLGQCADYASSLAAAACARFPLDWLWTGDDVASQQAMLMGPDCWRRLVKPHLARVVAVGKGAGLWVAYHSCGAIRPIIADLIEIGIDVINPVQVGCPGMDPFELKREYGADVAFMGGVDTQDLLPHGTVAMVRDATKRLLDVMACDGGYILAASHTVPPETPMENIVAMYEAAGIPLV